MANLYIYPKGGEPSTYPLGRAPGDRSAGPPPTTSSCPTSTARACHAVIAPTEQGYALIDQGSKNGTFVNGRRVTGEIDLARGDEILIGSTSFFFDRDLEPRVTWVEGTTFTHSSNTIIEVKDLLKKPAAAVGGHEDPGRGPRPGALPAGPEDHRRHQRGQPGPDLPHAPRQALRPHHGRPHPAPADGPGRPHAEEPRTPGPSSPRSSGSRAGPCGPRASSSARRSSGRPRSGGSSILISDIQADEALKAQASVVQAQIHSAMCVPLFYNDDIIGLIYCDRASLLEQFTENDLRLLTLLANLAANKIENARLIEIEREADRIRREMVLAAEIQKSFLPRKDPAFEPYEITGSARACRHVGGDYYDYIPIDADRLGIIIADVSGVGASASLLMANLRGALHEKFPDRFDLGELTAGLNDFIYTSSDSHCFITFFLGILDRRTDELAYVNAGHNPPLLVGREGPARPLEGTGLPLGMFPAQAYGERKAVLGPGDDPLPLHGRHRREPQGGDGGVRRGPPGADRSASSPRSPAREIMERIFEDVFGFSGCTEAGDDMTARRRQAEAMSGRGGAGTVDGAGRPGDHASRPSSARSRASGASSTTTSPAWASARRTGSRSSCRSTRSASTSPSTPIPKGRGAT
ncbi:MAG: SpoIIE family protein phosphatase [Candidatus Moduliflexus flocculans]|nr:SpoIIE family protein phosphatase [Candidatus Moduliflexus flocculans]